MVRPYAVSASRYGEYLEMDRACDAYWMGEGADRLALEGKVAVRDFALLEKGIDPRTGEVLRPHHRATGRSVYDLVVFAPKSASVVGMMDERITDAHKQAVLAIQRSIEHYAAVRDRRGELHGTDHYRPTQNIIAGVWQHQNSRKLDPLIHTHIAVLNLTFDEQRNQWKALQAVEFYRHRWELSEQYRYLMANSLARLGYEEQPKLHQSMGFEIAGVPPALLAKYSQRSEERDHILRWYQSTFGDEPTPRLRTELVREYREPKHRYTLQDGEALRSEQMSRLTPAEHAQLTRIRDESYERQLRYEIVPPEPYKFEPEKPRGHRPQIRISDHVDHEAAARNIRWQYGHPNGFKVGL